jgi:DNA processing protein
MAISVVGSRRATDYGKNVCDHLSRQLAANGFTIVSGFARGIDSIAHRGALEAGGRTIAVMGNGLSFIYPAENAKLMEEIAVSGACISEFPMSVPPMATNFPRRNRVISGLSLGTLVVEASEKSGSLITASLAAEQGREVLAVPGEIFSKMSKGAHNLIKQGAALVETVEDIIEALSLDIPRVPEAKAASEIEKPPDVKLGDEEQIIWNVLARTPTHIDDISRLSNLTPSKVSSILVMLELKGIVQQLPGKMFARKMMQRF